MPSTNQSPKDNKWLFLFILLTASSAAWTTYNAYHFFNAAVKTWTVKIPLMISLTFLFCSAYGIFLILYSRWANKTKNLLIHLITKEPRVVYSKYNRYFINEDLMHNLGYSPSSFKKLSQKDIGLAVEIAKDSKKTLIYSQKT